MGSLLTPCLLKWKGSTEGHRQFKHKLVHQSKERLEWAVLEGVGSPVDSVWQNWKEVYEYLWGPWHIHGSKATRFLPNRGGLNLSLRVFLLIILFQSLWEGVGGPLCQSHHATGFIIKLVRMSHADGVCRSVSHVGQFSPSQTRMREKRENVSILVLCLSCCAHQAESLRWRGWLGTSPMR